MHRCRSGVEIGGKRQGAAPVDEPAGVGISSVGMRQRGQFHVAMRVYDRLEAANQVEHED